MATKAGMVKLSDCVNGKTFYEVQIILDDIGGFETNIRTAYCCSRGVKKSVRKITDPHSRQQYLKNPLVYFDYWTPKKAEIKWLVCGIMLLAFNHPITSECKIISRLFTKRSYAERFVKSLELTFVPNGRQQQAVRYHEDWEKRHYEDAMDDIGKQIDILDQKQTVVEG